MEKQKKSITDNNKKLPNNTEELFTILESTEINWEKIEIHWDDNKRIRYIEAKIQDESLSEREKAYYNRILRVLAMPSLHKIKGNPINMIIEKILESEFFKWFDNITTPEIVSEWETFDLFNFSENHVARRPSDSYFVKKSENKNESMLLRPHTSVMRYYYLLEWNGKSKLEKTGEVRALSQWKVYRVDTLDKHHHECFHQIDGLRILSKEKWTIDQSTLKDVLSNTIKTLFGENVKYRFNEDTFPYTVDSLEAEVEYEWKRIEVLWAWVVNPTVLEKLWIDPENYTWRAFWFGIERLAMALKRIPDIRIFWSKDKRITNQRWNLDTYKEISVFPPVYKDISFLTSKDKFIRKGEKPKEWWKLELVNEIDIFDLAWIARDISWWLIEEVKVIDEYENDDKFWKDSKSVTIRITFRSLERTLTNEEINIAYFKIRTKLERELSYTFR